MRGEEGLGMGDGEGSKWLEEDGGGLWQPRRGMQPGGAESRSGRRADIRSEEQGREKKTRRV